MRSLRFGQVTLTRKSHTMARLPLSHGENTVTYAQAYQSTMLFRQARKHLKGQSHPVRP